MRTRLLLGLGVIAATAVPLRAQASAHVDVTVRVLVCPVLGFQWIGTLRELPPRRPREARFELPVRIAATVPWTLQATPPPNDTVLVSVADAPPSMPSAPLLSGGPASRDVSLLFTVAQRQRPRVVPVTLSLSCSSPSDAVTESRVVVRIPVRGAIDLIP